MQEKRLWRVRTELNRLVIGVLVVSTLVVMAWSTARVWQGQQVRLGQHAETDASLWQQYIGELWLEAQHLTDNYLLLKEHLPPQQFSGAVPGILENFSQLHRGTALWLLNGEGVPQYTTTRILPSHYETDLLQRVFREGQPAVYLDFLRDQLVMIIPLVANQLQQGALLVGYHLGALNPVPHPYPSDGQAPIYHQLESQGKLLVNSQFDGSKKYFSSDWAVDLSGLPSAFATLNLVARVGELQRVTWLLFLQACGGVIVASVLVIGLVWWQIGRVSQRLIKPVAQLCQQTEKLFPMGQRPTNKAEAGDALTRLGLLLDLWEEEVRQQAMTQTARFSALEARLIQLEDEKEAYESRLRTEKDRHHECRDLLRVAMTDEQGRAGQTGVTEETVKQVNDVQKNRALSGARVLLVEDDPINQRIIEEMLRILGVVVVLAENGAGAIKALSDETFDLVLMDIRMPVMAGDEATKRIRAEKKVTALPIIAMTAHNSEQDRLRCREAGMDDYLVKPLELNQLAEVLAEWIPVEQLAVRHEEAQTVSSVPASMVKATQQEDDQHQWVGEEIALPLTLKGFDMAAGLRRLDGNRALYQKMLHCFLESHYDDFSVLSQVLAAADYDAARALVHSLRGVAGSLGAMKLSKAAACLEENLSLEPVSVDSECLVVYHAALQEVLGALTQVPGGFSDEEKSLLPVVSDQERAVDQEKISQLLVKMGSLLETDLYEGRHLFEQLAPLLVTSRLRAEGHCLFQDLADYDTEAALVRIRRIATLLGLELENHEG